MTNKSNSYTTMKVSPEFKRMFKSEAANRGKSMFDLSLELANNKDKTNEKKIKFSFKL